MEEQQLEFVFDYSEDFVQDETQDNLRGQHSITGCIHPGCKRHLGFHGYTKWKDKALLGRLQRKGWRERWEGDKFKGRVCWEHAELGDREIERV